MNEHNSISFFVIQYSLYLENEDLFLNEESISIINVVNCHIRYSQWETIINKAYDALEDIDPTKPGIYQTLIKVSEEGLQPIQSVFINNQ
jgi:hypothetical protein